MPAAAAKVCCGRGTHMAVALATATGARLRRHHQLRHCRRARPAIARRRDDRRLFGDRRQRREDGAAGGRALVATAAARPAAGDACAGAGRRRAGDRARRQAQAVPADRRRGRRHGIAHRRLGRRQPRAAVRGAARGRRSGGPAHRRRPRSPACARTASTDAMGVLRALLQTPGDLFVCPALPLDAYVAKAALVARPPRPWPGLRLR